MKDVKSIREVLGLQFEHDYSQLILEIREYLENSLEYKNGSIFSIDDEIGNPKKLVCILAEGFKYWALDLDIKLPQIEEIQEEYENEEFSYYINQMSDSMTISSPDTHQHYLFDIICDIKLQNTILAGIVCDAN